MHHLRGSACRALVGLGLAALVSGCGDVSIFGVGGPEPSPTVGASQPTAVAKVGNTTAQVGGQLPASFPAGFPLPQGYQLQSAADDGRQIAVVLIVPSAQGAFDFYKQALPGAGYQVRELPGANVGGAFSGGFTLAGNGFNGELAVSGVGGSPLVSIRLERGGSAAPGAATVPGVAATVAPVIPGVPTVAANPGAPAPPKPGLPAPDGLPAGFPATFPLPPQYQVQSATDDGRQAAIVLSVQSAQAAYDFYKGALPLSGYQVREEGQPQSSAGLFTGGLSFTGNGQTGKIAFSSAGSANLITIGLERGGAAPAATAAVAAATPAPPAKPSEKPAEKPQGAPGLPAGFPLPPQAQVQTSMNDGRQVAVVLGVTSAKEAYEFYQKALPEAGYQITDRSGVDGPGGTYGGALKITGNGVSGELAFAANPAGQTVTIRLDGGGAAPAATPAAPAAPKPGQSGGPPVAALPAGFPTPPEHRVQAAADSGRQIAVVLIVPSVQSAFDFYKGALPGAGYEVTERGVSTTPAGGFNGVLSVKGAGVAGEIVCTSASGANMVTMSLNKS
jgi:catechol 2,3-dioxygenase-like lactoylglutathione lyase family enzyme